MEKNQKNSINALLGFLVPESDVSLKLLFDNVRNAAVAATFLSAAVWLRRQPGILHDDPFAPYLSHSLAAIALFLAILNVLHGYALGLKMLRALGFTFPTPRPEALTIARFLAATAFVVLLTLVQVAGAAAFVIALVRS